MFNWRQIEEALRQIINTTVRFIKARRREEAAITAGSVLIWSGIYFPELLEKVGLKELVASWKGDVIGRSILIAAGAGSVLYAAFKIFRLVYVPDLPPPQDRPSAIKGPMAFTEDDGALFRKLGRENDLQKLLGLILDNQVVMVVVRGASGAGKTSLLRAGLTHILAEKGVNYHYWEAAPTEPDKWLLHAIRETWQGDSTKPLTLDELVNPSDNLCRQAHVIVLDQFEQLRGSKSIFRLLRKIAREAKPPHRVTWVIAFREEFSKDWMDFIWPELEREVRPPRDLPLRLFTPEQAREVISQLVNDSGLSVEQAVVNNLVEAAMVEGEVSPVDIGVGLLALAELSERQGRKTVTIRDYQFAGGAEGLLTQYVGRCLELFAKEDRETILKAMLALRDPETHQRIAEGLGIDELAKEAGAEAGLLKPMLARLAQRDVRLLEIVTTPGKSAAQYRLPHERLIPAIHRLTGKLLAEVDQARLKFENAFLAWQKNGERSRYLMKGSDLRLAERFESKIPWGRDPQEKQRFLNRSKRRRSLIEVAAVATVLALIVSSWLGSLHYWRIGGEGFLYDNGYPQELYGWQHQLKRLALTEPLNLEPFNWLSSDSIEELELNAAESSDSIAGMASLARCHSLKKLTLNLSDSHVRDLEPLSKLTNLTQLSLDLGDCQVRDLGPLSKLTNLTHLSLDLGENKANDLEPLSKLTNLTHLSLNPTSISVSDLASLSKLSNLTSLSLDFQESVVRDLTPLSKLTNLTRLSLDFSGVASEDSELISQLGNQTQLSLDPGYRPASILTPLSELTNLTNLSLGRSYSKLNDLEPLSKLPHLTHLSLDNIDNQMGDLEPLSKLPHLTHLSLDFSVIQMNGLEPLSKLTNLTRLSLLLNDGGASELEPLFKLTHLTHLSIDPDSAQMSALGPLSNLTSLTSLDLHYEQGSNLEPLLKLPNLTQLELDIKDGQASDSEAISKLSKLTQLSLSFGSSQPGGCSQVGDLEPLSKLTGLTQLSLDISRCPVRELAPLSNLTSLTRLSLNIASSQVSDLASLMNLTRLQTFSIEGATRPQRMSLRVIPPSLVDLKF